MSSKKLKRARWKIGSMYPCDDAKGPTVALNLELPIAVSVTLFALVRVTWISTSRSAAVGWGTLVKLAGEVAS
jgi:hypothetical protein